MMLNESLLPRVVCRGNARMSLLFQFALILFLCLLVCVYPLWLYSVLLRGREVERERGRGERANHQPVSNPMPRPATLSIFEPLSRHRAQPPFFSFLPSFSSFCSFAPSVARVSGASCRSLLAANDSDN